ncbi:MAG: hypothetical protein ABR499_08745 [Gemmatimonadaceae bacterium]
MRLSPTQSLHALLAVLLAFRTAVAVGQETHGGHAPVWSGSAMAQGIAMITRATPTAGARSITEAYLTQPVLGARLSGFGGRLSAVGMLNFEGATLARGELNTGTYGEGYIDRRHPHSYVHELLAIAQAERDIGGRAAVFSFAAGRGFAPFGSDDPMARPFAKYPVNHHLAQVLERVVMILAADVGPMTLEGGVFNGDEPTSPRSVPVWSRFGDSWSTRATLRPTRGVELSASVARVESPEFREGLGLDQRKSAIVLRVERPERPGGGSRYLLVEWARTHDDRRGRVAFTYTSFLVEGAYCRRRRWAALRLERTTRPEEERLFDLFRTPRPQMEFAILGRTRWTGATAAAGTNVARLGVLVVAPFVEAMLARAERVEELAAFVPRDFYGSDRLWLLSLGARVNVGRRHQRMGRYGAAATHHAAEPHSTSAAGAAGC